MSEINPAEGVFLGGVGTLLGLAFFLSSFSRLKLLRAITNTPTSKVRSAAMGFVELNGLAEPDGEPLTGPLSGVPCVWWRFTVEEERKRTNSEGESETYWHTLADERLDRPFRLRDATGELRVDPQGAEVDTKPRLKTTSGGLFSGAKPTGPRMADFGGGGFFGRRMRYTEWRVEPQRPLFALGELRPSAQGPTLGRSQEHPFYLATMSEAEASRAAFWRVAGLMFFSLAFFGVCLYMVTHFMSLL